MSSRFESLKNLVRFYEGCGVSRIYVKLLAPNDNSKNQVYFGPGFDALTLFPMQEISPDPNGKNPIFKARVDFLWINDELSLIPAPASQIILYPQYPEVRFSGFLKGANKTGLDSIRQLMSSREADRVLFLGIDNHGRILGCIIGPNSPVAHQFNAIQNSLSKATEIFFELLIQTFLGTGTDPRKNLLEELCRIHRLGWIHSKRLDSEGRVLPCNAPQCGGYTLEAELGVRPNGRSEPDFHGWEVKQHSGNVLTLMTPEPTGGFYIEKGVEQFVRTFGYADKLGRADRINFGGTHFCNIKHTTTQLTMKLQGYDSASKKITNPEGGIALVADNGTVAALWAFAGILQHWNRKHRNAVYVSSEHRESPANQYRYRNIVKLGIGTNPLLLLEAIETGKVYYDPGIKLEHANDINPTAKRRSQFRVRLKDIDKLYNSIEEEDVTAYCN